MIVPEALNNFIDPLRILTSHYFKSNEFFDIELIDNGDESVKEIEFTFEIISWKD